MIYLIPIIVITWYFMEMMFRKNERLGRLYNEAVQKATDCEFDFSGYEYPETDPLYQKYLELKRRQLYTLVDYYSTWISLHYVWNPYRKQELKQLTQLFLKNSIPEKMRLKIHTLIKRKSGIYMPLYLQKKFLYSITKHIYSVLLEQIHEISNR